MDRRQWLRLAATSPLAVRFAKTAVPGARPTSEQLAWQNMELSMFVHFGPATWQDSEYDTLATPVDRINPSKLDTEQWAGVAQSLGAKQIVFVAKHTGGFCWWQTETSRYSARSTPWRAGKGDVMLDLSESCRRRGLRLGVYLSPQDKSLGAGLAGKTVDPSRQAAYGAIYRRQLTELLTRYGEISEVWFDGSSVVDVGDLLRRYAPHAIVFQSHYATIRWVGNEEGIAPDPNWNAVPEAAARSGVSTAKDGAPEGDTWLPCEVDARIHDTWFWNSRADEHLKTLDRLMSMYYLSVGHGALLLLNNTPDTTGLIPESHAQRTAEFGAAIRKRFAEPVSQTKGSGTTIELNLHRPTRLDHVMLMEDIGRGQRVRAYSVHGRAGDAWKEISSGTSIGHKKIDRFHPVELSSLILRIPHSEGDPSILKFAAFSAGAEERTLPAEISGYRVIYNWRPESFDTDRTIWDIDLGPFIRDAGEYQLTFVTTGGGMIVRSVTLMADGGEHDEFVTRVRSGVFRLKIPGLGTTLDLRVVVSTDGGDPAFGQIAISRVL